MHSHKQRSFSSVNPVTFQVPTTKRRSGPGVSDDRCAVPVSSQLVRGETVPLRCGPRHSLDLPLPPPFELSPAFASLLLLSATSFLNSGASWSSCHAPHVVSIHSVTTLFSLTLAVATGFPEKLGTGMASSTFTARRSKEEAHAYPFING